MVIRNRVTSLLFGIFLEGWIVTQNIVFNTSDSKKNSQEEFNTPPECLMEGYLLFTVHFGTVFQVLEQRQTGI